MPTVRGGHRSANGSVLDRPTNFRTDWIDKGFAVEKG
jgi:hypothetical protein